MQINEEYMVKLDSTCGDKDRSRPLARGRVVYVHPRGRYAALEFQGVHGRFRECFFPDQLTQRNRVG